MLEVERLAEVQDTDLAGREDARLEEAVRAVECMLFIGGGPVTVEQLAEAAQVPADVVTAAIRRLTQDYAGRGLMVQAVAGGYQLVTHPDHAEAVRRFLGSAGREPLSQAALEVLAIVAHRQPVTRAEIEAVRGVRSEHVLERLEERRLIRVMERKPTVGRPFMYGTTEAFLRHFGLRDLGELPAQEIVATMPPAGPDR